MNHFTRRSLPFIAALACAPAFAVWEYSVAAKVAIYDAIESVCEPVDPDLFQRKKSRLIFLSKEEWASVPEVRKSKEYRDIFDETVHELSVLVVGDISAKQAACAKVLKD